MENVNNRGMRPPAFGGGDQDVEEWLNQFERHCEFVDWKGSKKHKALKNLITGNAARWLQLQCEDETDTYDKLAAKLKDKYKLSQSKLFQLRMELSCITQEHGETVDHFFERLQTMAHRTELQDENQIMQYFIQGIRPGLRRHVLRIQPNDLDEAVEAARAEEGVEVMVPERGQVCTASGRDEKNQQQTVCQLCDTPGHTARLCERFANLMSRRGTAQQPTWQDEQRGAPHMSHMYYPDSYNYHRFGPPPMSARRGGKK